jgi:VWFA-related protein
MKIASVSAALTTAVVMGQATQQPTFRATTALVRLEVNVADEHGPVRGLRDKDFVVTDSGSTQSVTVQEVADAPLDVVVVAQPLRSISLTSDQQALPIWTALSAFVGYLEDRDRVGVLAANAPPTRVRPLTFGKPELNRDQFYGGQYSAVFDTITAALGEFVPSDRRQVLVVFCNGTDFRSTVSFDAVAAQARRLGPAFVLVSAPIRIEQQLGARVAGTSMAADVTVAGNVFPATLQLLARRTGGMTIDIGKGDPGALVKDTIVWMRTRYVLSYEPPVQKGWHPLTVRVNRRNATVVTRDGYSVD